MAIYNLLAPWQQRVEEERKTRQLLQQPGWSDILSGGLGAGAGGFTKGVGGLFGMTGNMYQYTPGALIAEAFTGQNPGQGQAQQQLRNTRDTLTQIGNAIQSETQPAGMENLWYADPKKMVYGGVANVSQQVPSLLVGSKWGEVPGLVAMGAVSGGQAYADALSQGQDEKTATLIGTLYGGIEGFTEVLPMKTLLSKWGDEPMKKAVKFMFEQAGQEVSAETLEAMVDKMTTQPDMTVQDFSNRMRDMLVQLPVSIGGTMAVGKGIQTAIKPPGFDATPSLDRQQRTTMNNLTWQYGQDVGDAFREVAIRPETATINTPERQQLRTSIEDQLYGQGAPSKNRRIDIVIGPPASGKSTVAEDIAAQNGSMIVDSDMAKAMLPEYDGGLGANAVHQESKQIADNVLAKAVQNGDNVVLPIVGKNPDKVKKILSSLGQMGYNTVVHSVNLPTNKALDRSIKRFRDTGRFVSPEYINSVGDLPSKTYEALKNDQAAQEFRAYSTDVPFGQKAVQTDFLQPATYGTGRQGRADVGGYTGEIGQVKEPVAGYQDNPQQAARLIDNAKKEFGITYSPGDAGFITPDGEMIDLSEGGGMGRTDDHRSIITTMRETDMTKEQRDPAKQNRAEVMFRWLRKTNSLRWSPESWGAEAVGMPTPEQIDTLANNAEMNGGTITLEYTNPNTLKTVDTADLTDATRGDIERFFRNADNKVRIGVAEHGGATEATTNEQKPITKAERDALAKVPARLGRRRYTVLGNAISKDFKKREASTLIGKKITTYDDLAVLAQVYRDPRYESMRYIFTNTLGDIVYQTGVSSRLPDSAQGFVGEDPEIYFNDVIEAGKKAGGVSLWLQHNHPSGNPDPSNADMNFTREIAFQAGRRGVNLRGHVVVNHKKFGMINPGGDAMVRELPSSAKQGYDVNNPSIPHPLLYSRVDSPESAAAIGKKVQIDADHVLLIGRKGVRGEVSLLAEIPIDNFDRVKFAATVRHLGINSGSGDLFLYGVPKPLGNEATKAIKAGLVMDAFVADDNGPQSLRKLGIDPGGWPYGKLPKSRVVMSEKAQYNASQDAGAPNDQQQGQWKGEPAFVAASRSGVRPQPLAEASKRGTQTWQATEHLAQVLGTNPAELDKLLRRTIGTAFNAEQLHQAADIMNKNWGLAQRELTNFSNKLDKGEMTDKDWIRVEELFHMLNAMQAQYMGVRGEAGRALQIFNKIKESTKIAEAVQQITDAHGGKQMLEAKLKAIATLDESGQGLKAVRDEMAVTNWDKFMEWYVNSLVSGIPTHVVNVTSNALVSVLEDIDRFVAAGVAKVTGGETTFREAAAHAAGSLSGSLEGVRAFGQAIWDENSPLQFRGKYDQVHRQAISGFKGKVIRTPTRFLGAEDAFFKTLAMTKELHALAARRSQQTGIPVKELIQNPPADMMEEAWRSGFERTFTNRPGPMAQALLSLRRDHPLVNLIFPFVSTPANIVNYGLKHTPAALAYRQVRQDIKAGGAKRDQAIARIVTGTGISMAVMAAALQGLITGAPPEDPNRRRLWYAAGNQPYSIKVGDTWYSYSRLEPVGMLFGISADMLRIAQTIGTDEADKLATLIIGSVSNNLLSKTYLRGLADTVNAITDPERYGERWVKSLVSGIATPVFLSYTAKAVDPNLREAETILEQLQSRIPGLSKKLEPRLDIFGNERVSEGSGAYRFFSPAWQKKDIKDPVARELLRLDVSMPAVGPKLQGVELTTAQRNELKKMLGKTVYNAVQRIISSPKYRRMPDPAKAYVLDKTISGLRRYGQLYWKMQHPEVMREAARLKREELMTGG